MVQSAKVAPLFVWSGLGDAETDCKEMIRIFPDLEIG